MTQTILLAGASGLVGRQVIDRLENSDLHLCVRRKISDLPATVTQHVTDPVNWPEVIGELKIDLGISCLGTTIRQAGSRGAFAAVDRDLVLEYATASRNAGARHFIAVSSVGAMPASSSFYLRTKAEMEQGLRNIGFQRLDIMRPSLLTGGHRDAHRPGEALGIRLSPLTDRLMIGPMRRFASTPSGALAKAIATLTDYRDQGAFIHENDSIRALAS